MSVYPEHNFFLLYLIDYKTILYPFEFLFINQVCYN